MIDLETLKSWIHKKDLERYEKIFILLAYLNGGPCSISDIKKAGVESGFKINKSWNLSDILAKKVGLVIKTPHGWELTSEGKKHLQSLNLPINSPVKVKIANDLRDHLKNFKNSDTQDFIEETISCHEHDLWRSAIVMSWVGAIHLLYHHVINNKLKEFNKEALRINSKWKPAKTIDDLARMKELDFLNHLENISVIGKSQKDALAECLKRRNGCGHPNSVKYKQNTVAHHIEVLLLNVYDKFA